MASISLKSSALVYQTEGAYLDPGESCDCREEEHIAGREEREENDYDSNSKH